MFAVIHEFNRVGVVSKTGCYRSSGMLSYTRSLTLSILPPPLYHVPSSLSFLSALLPDGCYTYMVFIFMFETVVGM